MLTPEKMVIALKRIRGSLLPLGVGDRQTLLDIIAALEARPPCAWTNDEAVTRLEGLLHNAEAALSDGGPGPASWLEGRCSGIKGAIEVARQLPPCACGEPLAEGQVELERVDCCRTQADEEGWGHIRVYIGAHWPAPPHSRRVGIFALPADEEKAQP